MWRREMPAGFCLENLKKRDNLEDIGVDVRIVLTWILKQWDGKEWTGFTWLRIGTSCRIL
jgi:hypothetical protein